MLCVLDDNMLYRSSVARMYRECLHTYVVFVFKFGFFNGVVHESVSGVSNRINFAH